MEVLMDSGPQLELARPGANDRMAEDPLRPTPATRPRRFTLLDGMILVAAIAAGLAINRATLSDISWAGLWGGSLYILLAVLPPLVAWTLALLVIEFRARRRRSRWFDGMILVTATAAGLAMDGVILSDVSGPGPGISQAIYSLLVTVLPHLVAWTFALLAIRLRAPRPDFRRLARQPGFVACGAAASAALLCAASSGLLVLANGSRSRVALTSFVYFTPELCFVVVGAWLALAANGRWRAEPGWIDRLGRTIGVLWIAANLLHWIRLVLM
jgi:hypothetical protein